MSPGTDRVFRPTLRDLEGALALPIPDRLRILSELEFDLEQMRGRFVADGFSADQARAKALEALAPGSAALEELSRLHAPVYARVTRGLDQDRLRRLERGALLLATVSVLVTETLALLRMDLLSDSSRFLWPVLGLGALLFAAIAAKVFELWIKADHRAPRRGLSTILGLAAFTTVAGIGGALLDFIQLAATLERTPRLAGVLFPEWVVRDAALLAVAILITLAGGLAWFGLSQWIASVSSARRAVLGPSSETN